jgi:hypothetical protein
VVELAGMSARCDFDEQVGVTSPDGMQRPDMVVRLAGGKNIVVDSKVSLAAYLEAAEATDEDVRDARMDAHARHLRDHVDRLAAKAYWAALSPSPEFVVLFIPGEAFLAPALERDPGLLEHAMARKVHIATPTTLVTMLRTAQYAWQQEALADNARAVFDLGRELYERIAGWGSMWTASAGADQARCPPTTRRSARWRAGCLVSRRGWSRKPPARCLRPSSAPNPARNCWPAPNAVSRIRARTAQASCRRRQRRTGGRVRPAITASPLAPTAAARPRPG